jgi:peptidoglycan hydrolase-like protein with peptidoglycan-binding domain
MADSGINGLRHEPDWCGETYPCATALVTNKVRIRFTDTRKNPLKKGNCRLADHPEKIFPIDEFGIAEIVLADRNQKKITLEWENAEAGSGDPGNRFNWNSEFEIDVISLQEEHCRKRLTHLGFPGNNLANQVYEYQKYFDMETTGKLSDIQDGLVYWHDGGVPPNGGGGSSKTAAADTTEPENVRNLKRGVRGEDVFGWQTFLMKLRERPEFSSVIPSITVDGIFGPETKGATVAFQTQLGLKSEGTVGKETRDAGKKYGLVPIKFVPHAPAPPPPPQPQVLLPLIITPTEPPPPPPPPPPPIGSSRADSWKRMRAWAWEKSQAIQDALVDSQSVLQLPSEGSGDFVYDEYRVDVTEMPKNLTPEAFLVLMAKDLNGTIKNPAFDGINVFKRRNSGELKIGEIIDIDIKGPDDGSVMLVEIASTYFIFQTIDTPATGSHPENGAREFGFQKNGEKVTFYTRTVSRPAFYLAKVFGATPQREGWTALMHGISDAIVARGGKSNFSSFSSVKELHEK